MIIHPIEAVEGLITAPELQTAALRTAPIVPILPGQDPILPGAVLPPAGAFVPVPHSQHPGQAPDTAVQVLAQEGVVLENEYISREPEVRSFFF